MPWLFRVDFLYVLTDSRVAFFTLAMGLMCFIYLICSLRTNICFVIIFLTLVLAFATLTGAYFQISNGNGALNWYSKLSGRGVDAVGAMPGA